MSLLEMLDSKFKPLEHGIELSYCLQAYTRDGHESHECGNVVPYGQGRTHVHLLGYDTGDVYRLTQLELITSDKSSNNWTVVWNASYEPFAGGLDALRAQFFAFTTAYYQRYRKDGNGDLVIEWEKKPNKLDEIHYRTCPTNKLVRSYSHMEYQGTDLLSIGA